VPIYFVCSSKSMKTSTRVKLYRLCCG